MNAIVDYNEDDSENDAENDEKRAHNEEEGTEKGNNGDHSTSRPANDTNFARHISRTSLDVHDLIPCPDPGLFIPGMPTNYHEVEEDIVIGQKRSHPGGDDDDADTPGPSKARRSSKMQQSARDGNNKGKTHAFEKRQLDLVLVDHSTQELQQPWGLWRHFAVFKRDRESGPTNGTTLTSLVAQDADTARLHLAARPFMRFSVGLPVCGPIFNLTIFDRVGGVVCEDYNVIKDLETFIRIIHRLGRDLDGYHLGLERTTVPLHTFGSWKQFPEFRVTVGGMEYATQGLPLRQSTDLIDRGTSVWVIVLEVDAKEFSKGKARTFILKNARRGCARLAESTIYKMIYGATGEPTSRLTNLDGVAKFVGGGDIYDPQQPNEMVKVSSHRKGFGGPINENDDPILHPLVLASRGRKLYEFTTFSQLMRAAKKMSSGTHGIFSLCFRLTICRTSGTS